MIGFFLTYGAVCCSFSRRSNCALEATIIVEKLIATAPRFIGNSSPQHIQKEVGTWAGRGKVPDADFYAFRTNILIHMKARDSPSNLLLVSSVKPSAQQVPADRSRLPREFSASIGGQRMLIGLPGL